jgi:2-phospho-L-lactate guanylyltransferase
MRVLVPFDASDPNTRLAPVLDDRAAFAEAMLADVLAAIRNGDHEPVVLATESVDVDARVRVDDRPLSPAVNAALAEATLPVAVVMSDLPLVGADTIRRLVETAGEVVLAPGLGGGTNALVVRDSGFRVDYHGGSYRTHRQRARECDLTHATVDSFRLALDVDTPDDLGEVLLHGEGQAAAWLREAGFELDESDGRATALRRSDS